MILQNAVQILHKGKHVTYLKSAHVHDWQSFSFNKKDFYFVDGGNEYIRRGGTVPQGYQVVQLNLDLNSSFQECYDKMLWGTRGPNGDQPVKYVLLRECEEDHLLKIWQYILDVKELDSMNQIRRLRRLSVISFLIANRMLEIRQAC